MLRRLVPATAAAALLVTGLAGCSAQQAASSDCVAPLSPGMLSNSVTVLGGFGTAPQISVPEDVAISATQRTIVESSGETSFAAQDQSLVGVQMAFFDSATGDELYASPDFGDVDAAAEFLLVDDEQPNPLSYAVQCAMAGDRVVLALSPEDSAALGASIGGTTGAPLIGVFDVVSASPLAAQGPVRGLPSGYPAVVTADEGRPGVVLPPTAAPSGITSATRIAGDGATVGADDNVIAQVLSVSWDGTVQTNTWESSAIALGAESDVEASGNTFRAELTGTTAGSQIVIVENNDGVGRVVVVDVLAVS